MTMQSMFEHVYFGRIWPVEFFRDAELIATPLGAVCGLCHDLVDEDDSGTVMHVPEITPWVNNRGGDAQRFETGRTYVHTECWLRLLAGDVPHLEGRCGCDGERELRPDEENLTFRQEALRTKEWIERQCGLDD